MIGYLNSIMNYLDSIEDLLTCIDFKMDKLLENREQEKQKVMNPELTLLEAANLHNTNKHALHRAISDKKLKAKKVRGRWIITLDDLHEYYENRWDRKFSKYKGKPLHDSSKGEFSVEKAAKELGTDRQHVYYALQKKILKGSKKGGAWVIKTHELEAYRKLREKHPNYLRKDGI